MIKIKSIQLEGHTLPIPEGLSELLNNGNGWGKKQENINPEYIREVVKRDGKLITVLKKRGETKCS